MNKTMGAMRPESSEEPVRRPVGRWPRRVVLSAAAVAVAAGAAVAVPAGTASAAPVPATPGPAQSPQGEEPKGLAKVVRKINGVVYHVWYNDSLDPTEPGYKRKLATQIVVRRVTPGLVDGTPDVPGVQAVVEDIAEFHRKSVWTVSGLKGKVAATRQRITELNQRVDNATTGTKRAKAKKDLKQARKDVRFWDKKLAEVKEKAVPMDWDREVSRLENKIGEAKRQTYNPRLTKAGRAQAQQELDQLREELAQAEADRKRYGRPDDGDDGGGAVRPREKKPGPTKPPTGTGKKKQRVDVTKKTGGTAEPAMDRMGGKRKSGPTVSTPAIKPDTAKRVATPAIKPDAAKTVTAPVAKPDLAKTVVSRVQPPVAPKVVVPVPTIPRFQGARLGTIRPGVPRSGGRGGGADVAAAAIGDVLGQMVMERADEKVRRNLDRAIKDPKYREALITEYQRQQKMDPIDDFKHLFATSEVDRYSAEQLGRQLSNYQMQLDLNRAVEETVKAIRAFQAAEEKKREAEHAKATGKQPTGKKTDKGADATTGKKTPKDKQEKYQKGPDSREQAEADADREWQLRSKRAAALAQAKGPDKQYESEGKGTKGKNDKATEDKSGKHAKAKAIAKANQRAAKSNADPLYQQARHECGGYDTCVTERTRKLREQQSGAAGGGKAVPKPGDAKSGGAKPAGNPKRDKANDYSHKKQDQPGGNHKTADRKATAKGPQRTV
ncbi:hypothetical protein [Kitasatospora camelliae]|uniref:Uncharacterized protein n=1 Tax=Kitasatospora camelliae TaxID=3156397 RepID=A0AAU8K6Q9_9ACTN